MNTFTLKGTFLDTPAPDTLRVREGYLLCENGLCAGFSETAPAGVEVLDYTGKIITPGLVDLHLHAPQYSYCGTAMDLELLDWLQQYTYPEEAHYADPAYGKGVAEALGISLEEALKAEDPAHPAWDPRRRKTPVLEGKGQY